MPSCFLIIYTCSLFWFFTTQTILLLCCLHRLPYWLPHWWPCWSVAPFLIAQHSTLLRGTILLSVFSDRTTDCILTAFRLLYTGWHIQAFNKCLLKMNEVWGGSVRHSCQSQEGGFLGSKGIVNRCYGLKKTCRFHKLGPTFESSVWIKAGKEGHWEVHSHLHIQWFAKGTCRTTVIERYTIGSAREDASQGVWRDLPTGFLRVVQCLCPEEFVGLSKSRILLRAG